MLQLLQFFSKLVSMRELVFNSEACCCGVCALCLYISSSEYFHLAAIK